VEHESEAWSIAFRVQPSNVLKGALIGAPRPSTSRCGEPDGRSPGETVSRSAVSSTGSGSSLGGTLDETTDAAGEWFFRTLSVSQVGSALQIAALAGERGAGDASAEFRASRRREHALDLGFLSGDDTSVETDLAA